MKEKYKIIAIAIVIFLLIIGATFLYNNLRDNVKNNDFFTNSSSSAETSPSNEQKDKTEKMKAPDFTVKDSSGNDVKLSGFIGKPVVINFWASWCTYCKMEMPDFQEVYSDNSDEVVFMMINATDGMRETIDKAKEFYNEKGYTMPAYFDVDSEAGNAYSVSSLPTTFFIDAEGYLVTGASGALSKDILLKGIGYITE